MAREDRPPSPPPLCRRRSICSFDVRQLPAFVQDGLLRPVHAEPREPLLVALGVEPVRLFAGRRLRAKVEVYRAIGVLGQALVERAKGEVRCVQEETRRLQAVDGDRPKFAHRYVCRDVEAVVIPAFERATAVVVEGSEVETAGTQLCCRAEILRES